MTQQWMLRPNSGTNRSSGTDETWRNPVRGFYHVYTYDLTAQEPEEDWVWSLEKGERLALVLLDIGGCAERALSDAELAKAGRIFSLFSEHQMQMIVRVVYDREGHGMEREPGTLAQVQAHMRQLSPVLLAYAGHIFVFQGLFIGSWGEMHDSRYLDAESLRTLYRTLCDATGGQLRISVRKPQYQRLLREPDGTIPVGLYDDAILGSDTDMGTFGWIDDLSDETSMWTPLIELSFISRHAGMQPCGGELLAGALTQPWEQVLTRLRTMQLTYLNRVHEPAVWERWAVMQDERALHEQRTRLDTVRRYLGYRYVLREVLFSQRADAGVFDITIRNEGFACCYDGLRLELAAAERRAEVRFDGKMLAAGADTRIGLILPLPSCADPQVSFPVSLTLYHEKTGLPIYFADAVPCKNQSSSAPSAGMDAGVLFTVNAAQR